MMIFIGVLIFALLVVVHEFGHFIVARRNGIEVEEFGIGFPPKLFSKKVGETEYSFNLVPLGGFVKLKGESDNDTSKGSFGVSSLPVKARVLMAGVGMNVVAAFFMVLILALTSLPTILPDQYRVSENETRVSEGVIVADIAEDSAAEAAGLEIGDRVVRIQSIDITTAQQLADTTEELAGEEVEVTLQRGSEEILVYPQLGNDPEAGQLGIAPIESTTSRYTWAAPVVAMGVTMQMIGLVFSAVANIVIGLFSGTGGEAASQLTGPVGIVFLLQNLGSFGFEYLFFLLASISISLAVFNALPIPALDGGRLAVISAARLVKRELKPELENAIHGAGFLALIGLFILITYVDIQRFFG